MHARSRRRSRARLAACAAAAALALTACTGGGGGGGGQGSGAPGDRLTDEGRVSHLVLGDFSGQTNPKANYNPFSATALGPLWTIYDQLYVVNSYDCTEEPQLATGYEWTSPTELRITTRDGVTWNDGEPFSARDVAFTFNLLRDNPALDTRGVAPGLVGAEATSGTEVVLTFEQPSFSRSGMYLQTLVVAEHVWADVDDPVTFTAEDAAVGTGAFTVKSFNPQRFTVERNPDSWRADTVVVDEPWFEKADAGGQVDQLKLARGEYDNNSMYVPDIEETYVAKDPEHHHYWFPSGSPISLFMNLEQAPFDDVEFRRAISVGLDRVALTEDAGSGYVEVASQTLLVLPGQSDWLDPTIPDEGYLPYDPDAADAALTAAGYALDDSGRRLGKDGEPMRFSFITPQGWSDWTAAANSLKDDFDALGIQVTVETPEFPTLEQDRLVGNFDMTFGVRAGQCSMFQNYDEPLGSANTAPIGERATTNEVRWSDAHTDDLLAQLAGTPDADEQKPIVHQLQQVMVDEVPFIPLWYGGKWFEFTTKNVTGWPSAEDPHAGPDNQHLIFTRLTPVTG
ncbi:ABC transporter substrate-binding protein [Cellulomonas sp.]|uniref:ABC transporter substrate-binding protein n=1 Tax=Cellulomonas sp. TaxID=40001 RepID=UPI002D2310A7|nr:ABC transporter substrate-binding protein [Cellulomonas sp.]HYQ74164.1 ABC transporter substrate-binding protein [Cellulomonas sp.]